MDTWYKSPISDKYAADILSYLYEHEEIKITDLHCIVKNYTSLANAVDLLTEAGLIERINVFEPRYKRSLILTERGMRVAELMSQAHRIVCSDDPVEDERARVY
jgi:DNA-binding transcriptional ArsR family regulator